MKTKPNALRTPAVYGSWQQVRATDKPDSQESLVDLEISAVCAREPETKANCGGKWQQVRATDETESSNS